MLLTAAQAKERILSGDISGDHEVVEDLDMSHCSIGTWPSWKYGTVSLLSAQIKRVSGCFHYLDCANSTLEEINPNIQVTSIRNGLSAFFTNCKSLKRAQGTFGGFTNWSGSSIQEIDPNTKFGTNVSGTCAYFERCESLAKVQGNFPGFTSWNHSNIQEIDTATKFGVDTDGSSAHFISCLHLSKAAGKFPGATHWTHSNITQLDPKIELGVDHHGISANFEHCKKLNPITSAVKPQGVVLGNIRFAQKAPPLSNMEF